MDPVPVEAAPRPALSVKDGRQQVDATTAVATAAAAEAERPTDSKHGDPDEEEAEVDDEAEEEERVERERALMKQHARAAIRATVDVVDRLSTIVGELPIEQGATMQMPPFWCPTKQLRPHQVFGLRWLERNWESGLNAILADEMGLGKTAQAIALLARIEQSRRDYQRQALETLRNIAARNEPGQVSTCLAELSDVIEHAGTGGPALIIVPSSVIENWRREIDHWAGGAGSHRGLQVMAWQGSKANRLEALEQYQAHTSALAARCKLKHYSHLQGVACLEAAADLVRLSAPSAHVVLTAFPQLEATDLFAQLEQELHRNTQLRRKCLQLAAQLATRHLVHAVSSRRRGKTTQIRRAADEAVNGMRPERYPGRWSVLIVDEAHNLKNAASKRFRTAAAINSEMRVLLTGTPVQNNVQELFALLAFLAREIFSFSSLTRSDVGDQFDDDAQGQGGVPSVIVDAFYDEMRDRTTTPVTAAGGLTAAADNGTRGGEGAITQQIQRFLQRFLLRRTKEEVLRDLPQKHSCNRLVGMLPAQQRIYRTLLLRGRDRRTKLQHSSPCSHTVAGSSDLVWVAGQQPSLAMAADAAAAAAATSTPVTSAETAANANGKATSGAAWRLLRGLGAQRQSNVRPLPHVRRSNASLFHDLRKAANHPLLLRTMYTDMDVVAIAEFLVHGRVLRSPPRWSGRSRTSDGSLAAAVHLEAGAPLLGTRRPRSELEQSAAAAGAAAPAGVREESMDTAGVGGVRSRREAGLSEVAGEEQAKPCPEDLEPAADAIQSWLCPCEGPTSIGTASELHSACKGDKRVAKAAARMMKQYSDYKLHQLCLEERDGLGQAWTLPPECVFAGGKLRFIRQQCFAAARANEQNAEKQLPEKILVFSQFTDVLDIVQDALERDGHRPLRLDGQTSTPARQAICDTFQADPSRFVMLLSTRAGGVGLNLTAANQVIIHDQDFNPMLDKQAEDRAHRIGQTRPVVVHRLASEGSIERRIMAISSNKELLRRILLEETQRKSKQKRAKGEQTLAEEMLDAELAALG